MGNISIQCSNHSCHFYNNLMPWPDNVPLIVCPICGSSMEKVSIKSKNTSATDKFDDATEIGINATKWLSEIAYNTENWFLNAEKQYPAVIAHEYKNLHTYCYREEPYAVLLSIKDNFEALMKLEVLLAFSWAARTTNEAFEANTISLLMTPNLSLGSWVEFASLIGKRLKKANLSLPDAIPLEILRKRYIQEEIVSWRNTNIGHGAMAMDVDEEFRQDLYNKIILLKDLFEEVDKQLSNQELYLCIDENNDKVVLLTGADRAREIEGNGLIYLRTKDGELNFCVDPFIVIRRHKRKGYGIYFFDNQRTKSLTNFLAYAEGSRTSENVGYFEYLRRQLETMGIKEEARADDLYLTEKEIQEIDLLQMSHSFVKPEHIINWLSNCLNNYDRGIFLLQMNRGTGKSVFTEKVSSLTEKPIKLKDDVDVRTYHFSRSQVAGIGDVRSGIEWLWGRDYYGNTWVRAPRISDFEKKGISPGEAICAYLEEVQKYSVRNRGKSQILMVFDGVDEISKDELWNFIPKPESLEKGLYFLLTARDPQTEELPYESVEHLNNLVVTNKYCPERQSDENTEFLKDYIQNTGLKGIDKKDIEKLLLLSDYRVLKLGMLCRLAEDGIGIEELPESNKVVAFYLEILEKRYGEKETGRFRELLALLCTLGMYEGLTLGTLGALTGENGVTLRLIGLLRDLSPMIKTERGEEKNLYLIANADLSHELEIQIPETEDVVRWIVKLALSAIHDGSIKTEPELEAAVAHVAELSRDKLPEGVNALGTDWQNTLLYLVNSAENSITDRHSRERVRDYQKQLLICCNDVFGEKHPETLTEKSYLAIIYGDLGDYEEALIMHQEVYESRKMVLGSDHIQTLTSLGHIATVHNELGHYEEALQLKQIEYEKKKNLLGDDALETLTAKNNLANTLGKLGNREEALQMYQEVYEASKKILGDTDKDTLMSQQNLAITWGELGHFEEALKILKEIFEKIKVFLGPKHRDTLLVQSNLAYMLKKLRHFEEAAEMFQEVYEGRKKILGSNHPDTLSSQNDLASIFEELGKYNDALSLRKEIYERQMKQYGIDNSDTIETMVRLVFSLTYLKRYEEALCIQQEIYDKRKLVLGNNHPKTLDALSTLAYIR